jgi:hypothetical protein
MGYWKKFWSGVGNLSRQAGIDFLEPTQGSFSRRPTMPAQPRSINREIDLSTRNKIVAASRKLWQGNGVLKGAIGDKAMYAVGSAWIPTYHGKDREWGKRAQEWLVQEWFPVCDIRGGIYDFRTALYSDSVAVDRDGDVVVLLTKRPGGYPALQRIPGHRIRSFAGDGYVSEGTYKGLRIRHGIILNKHGTPVAIRVKSHDEEWDVEYRDISMRNCIYLGEPDWYESYRSLPAFTHALLSIQTLATTQDYEEMALLLAGSIGLIKKSNAGTEDDIGGILDDDPIDTDDDEQPIKSGVLRSKEMGAMMHFIEANGETIEQMKIERPGASWEAFNDRIIRIALAGASWPYSFTWKEEGSGPFVRQKIGQAMRAVADRQDLLEPAAKRMIIYALAVEAMRPGGKVGALPDDFWKWSFSKPPSISIDQGYDVAGTQKNYEMGLITLGEIVRDRGKVSVEEHLRERADEWLLAQSIAKETGVPIRALMPGFKNQGTI